MMTGYEKVKKYALENINRDRISLVVSDGARGNSRPQEYIPGVPALSSRRMRNGWLVEVSPKRLIEVLQGT